jgi:integral membrane protein (TIGR01906 family)
MTDRPAPRGWEVAAFAAAFAVAALVGLAHLWAGDAPYRAVMSRQPLALFTVVETPAERRSVPLEELERLHAGWSAYVLGRSEARPDGRWFTADEQSHMADVRAVFAVAQRIALLAALGLAVLVWRARSAVAALARSGAIAAAMGVAAVGAIAAVAFDAVFQLFHEAVFPQGNFLFPPGSNLIALYPEPYWYTLTVGIAASFLALAAAVAIAGHIALRASTARSAIVSTQ